MKIKEFKKSVSVIKSSYGDDDFESTIEDLAVKNNMCLLITDKYGHVLYSCEMLAGRCLIHSNGGEKLFSIKNKVLESDNGEVFYRIKNDELDSDMLVYGMYIGKRNNIKAYVFLNAMLDPVESSAFIIKRQLMYISVIVLVLASLITLFISKKISKPIVRITKSAQKFAKGDYSVNFEGNDYQEVEQLSTTLNYAGREISKVDGLRKELISNISHDLRTPLTIIKAYAEMVRDLSGDIPKKREEHIGIIINESDRLSNLVNELLELSKYESSNQTLELSSFNINDKLIEVLKRYEIYCVRDGYTFEYIADESVDVIGDMMRIEQVLFNLIDNAVNYTGEDKKITIRQINKETAVRIEILDTGKGIPRDMLPLIFDRYYRDKKTAREVVGTGLGLSIVKEILKLHSFPFGVLSEEGKGSTFWFEIKKT